MATIKAYTDIEQSRKLAEILPLESADMCFNGLVYPKEFHLPTFNKTFIKESISCWSLAALLDVLPDGSEDNYFLTLSKEGAEYCCCYEDINGNSFRHTFADNPIDACYEMIIHLHKLKML